MNSAYSAFLVPFCLVWLFFCLFGWGLFVSFGGFVLLVLFLGEGYWYSLAIYLLFHTLVWFCSFSSSLSFSSLSPFTSSLNLLH